MTTLSAETAWYTTGRSAALSLVGLACAVLGVVMARWDLTTLGALALGVVLAARAFPGRTLPRTDAPTTLPADHEAREVPGLTLGDSAGGRHTGILRLSGPTRVRVSVPGYRDAAALLAPGEVRLAFRSVHTGILPTFRVDYAEVASGLRERGPSTVTAPPLIVQPRVLPLGELPLPRQVLGLTGEHTSRRRGEGEDLRDIAEYAPGDRLRSIDWRVTARRGTRDPRLPTQLYVRRTHAMAEAVVMLVLDSRDDVSPDIASWAGGTEQLPHKVTSIDVARTAVASLASAYIAQGDRVGLADLATRRRALTPGAGPRQLARLRFALALARPEGEPTRLFRAPQITSGALVVLVSTLLDDGAAAAAADWAALGHRVIVVDVLPDLSTRGLSKAETVAARVVLAERDTRVSVLVRSGIPVVPWRAATSSTEAAEHLRALSRVPA